MKHTREIVQNGVIYREVKESSGVSQFFGDLNQSIGRSLTPIRIRGGFCVSASWLLFGLVFCVDSTYSPFFFMVWLVSLFVRFE